MKPTLPNHEGRKIVYAAEQEAYEPLPAVIDEVGVTWTRWEFSEDERRAILDGAALELLLWTFGSPLQPVYLRVEGVEEPVTAEAQRV